MAGDWLKMEVDLPEKPEVWQIAGLTHLDPDAVVGKLLKVWRWFDAHTETGNARGVTYPLLDSLVGVTGFAEAMVFAGWLEQHDRDLCLPKFDRHNGKTAKNRALTAKRVAKNRNADVTLAALPREEKRREEKEEKKKTAPDGDLLAEVSPQIAADFRELRAKLRAPITATAVAGIRREAAAAGITLESALAVCCERGWRGFKADWMKAGRGNEADAFGGVL